MATYAIRKHQRHSKVELNALPCKIHYNGPVEASKHWKPTHADKNTASIHFRGRKLKGKILRLPERYEGHVLRKTEQVLQSEKPAVHDFEDETDIDAIDGLNEQEEEVKVMDHMASFDEIVVWNHDSVPLDASDPYVKAIQEWITLAEAIHKPSDPTSPA